MIFPNHLPAPPLLWIAFPKPFIFEEDTFLALGAG